MMLPRKLLAAAIIAIAVVAALFLGLWMRNSRPTPAAMHAPVGGLECGQWAVFRACELLGVPVSPPAVRDMMPAGPRGHSMKEIADVLRRAGLVTRGKKESFETFLAGDGIRVVHLPSPEHFIVVVRSTPDRVFFFDDQGRRRAMNLSVLRNRWSGNVLHVERPPVPTALGFVGLDPDAQQPRVQFETLYIEKGDVPTGDDKSILFTYPVRNFGTSDLVIKKVHPDCSCIAAEKPSQPIPPGGTDTVTLRYTLDNQRTSFLHEAVVETNDPAYPLVALRAAGNTNALVSVSPAALDLGDIPAGGESRAYVFIRYTGEEEFVLRDARSTVPNGTLTTHETVSRELAERLWPGSNARTQLGKGGRLLEFVVSPPAESLGKLSGDVIIETNIRSSERIKVPVTGRVVSPVAAVPSLLNFGEVDPGEATERTLSLISRTNKPFRVVSISPEVAGLEWKETRTADASRIQLHFSGTGRVAQKASGTVLVIKVESEGRQSDLPVPVFAAKKPAP